MTRGWRDDRARLAALETEHRFDLRLASDPDLAAQRAQHMNLGPPPQAYLNRWVRLGDGLAGMFGIRFEGGDGGRPFVDVCAVPREVRLADLAALTATARCLEAGDLFDVLVGETWAGYVGAGVGTAEGAGGTLGLDAYVVRELLLTPPFRGRGHGASLSMLLAGALLARDGRPDRVLLGTIHADNRGAVQAALAAGRLDVGGWVRAYL
jgi:hypothetical protein